MLPSPLRYDVHWTAKLLRRDVRNLKTKYTTKLKSKFTSKSAKASAPPHQQVEIEATVKGPEVPHCIAEPSLQSTRVSTEPPRSSSTDTPLSPATTAPTQYTEDSENASQKGFSTLYELLETKLKESYASRDRDMAHEDRWKYRGSWLLLHMAIQACPSNSSYDIFKDGKVQALDEKTLLLDILQCIKAKASGAPVAAKVSQVPSEPYSKRSSDHIRYDSAFSAVSMRPSPPAKPYQIPPPAQIWHAILQATTDQMKTTSIAEDILSYIWPDKDVTEVIDQIGHPQKTFRDEGELRARFQEMLFPEYKTLVKAC